MPAFKRLTDDEARQLTRGELLDRLEAEQAYWHHKVDRGQMSAADHEAWAEFRRIMRYIDPASAVADARRVVDGRGEGRSYWDSRPADDSTCCE